MYKSCGCGVCAVVLMGLGAGGALAGEVTGPPGSVDNPPTKATGAPSHSTSNCSFNGLNDFNQGPTDNKVQTPILKGCLDRQESATTARAFRVSQTAGRTPTRGADT